MTIADINNPRAWDYQYTMHNPRPRVVPYLNPMSCQWDYLIRDNNPEGPMPVLNPHYYINPLSGRYTEGPLQF